MTGEAKAPLLRKEREEMDTKTKEALLGLARKTARAIRNRTRIPGWHENEERFPESDFTDILGMLEKAYSLAEETAKGKYKGLVDEIIGQAEWSGCSDRSTMEVLLEHFEPEELVRLGCGERVKSYLEEYGGEGEWDEVNQNLQDDGSRDNPESHSLDELRDEMEIDYYRVLAARFPSTHGQFPEDFLDAVAEDVYETSGWQESGTCTEDDISLAIQREILRRIGGRG